MLLAVFLTAGFSLSAAQASIMSARMAGENAMAMPAADGMSKMAMDSDCKACLKDPGSKTGPMHCPQDCISPAVAVLPQGPAMTIVPRMQRPSALPTPLLHGRSSLPDPSPPRPTALV
ncbi:conserved exported hypothetical protein [Mesorhizobium sp. ORS 3324]|nr:conserved exported hypothetical protein [Mesorhizobium sp. ORS 3324]